MFMSYPQQCIRCSEHTLVQLATGSKVSQRHLPSQQIEMAKQVCWILVLISECEVWVCSSMVEPLPHLCEALTSISCARKMMCSRVLIHKWDFHEVTSLLVRRVASQLGSWCIAVSTLVCAFVDIWCSSSSSDWVVKVSVPSFTSRSV